MSDIQQIGTNIRFYREKMGLTQRALADSVLVSFQAISAWERGLSIPDLENVVRLAHYFGVTVDALLTGSAQELFVGIHGSSSTTEFVLFEKDGTVRNIIRLSGSNPNDRGLDASLDVLCGGMEQLLAGRSPKSVFAGISGASVSDLRQAIIDQLKYRFRTHADVDTDAANVLSCATNPDNAMAIICGTGSCVFVRKNSNRYRLGGWGHLLDQAGSGYDVGKDALRCALAAEDGLQEKTPLTCRIAEMFEGNPYNAFPMVYKNGRPYVAALAPKVVEAALEGDSCAVKILKENAQRLADLIQTAIRRFGVPEEIVASGSFIQHKIFKTMVENMAEVKLTLPDVPPVYGACVEALRAVGLTAPADFRRIFLETYQRMSR